MSLLLNHDNHQTLVDISHQNMLSQLYVKTHPRRAGNKVRSQVIQFNRQPGNPIFLQQWQFQYTVSDVLAPYSYRSGPYTVYLKPFHGTYHLSYVPWNGSRGVKLAPLFFLSVLCTSQRYWTWCNKTISQTFVAHWLHHCRDRLHTHVIPCLRKGS